MGQVVRIQTGTRMTKWYAGVDLGGTSIKWTSVDEHGEMAAVRSVPTPLKPDAVRAAIAGCVREARLTHRSSPEAVCIGTPGLISDEGVFVGPVVNIGGWQGTDPRTELEKALGTPVLVKNDTTLALLAEVTCDESRSPVSHAVGLFLGTGIGGGLFLDGRLYEGHRGIAGEIGHMVVDPGGRLCGCGSSGCLEQYASGRAIVAQTIERAGSYDTPLAAMVARAPSELTAAQVLEMPDDPLAAAVIGVAGDMLARAVGSLVMSLAPELVILGGGVMESGEALRRVLTQRLPDYVITEMAELVEIRHASLGHHAGAIGAALYARSSSTPEVTAA